MYVVVTHTNRFQFPLKRICERERSVNYRVSLGFAQMGKRHSGVPHSKKKTIKDTLMEKRKPQNRSHSLYQAAYCCVSSLVCVSVFVRLYTGQVNLI